MWVPSLGRGDPLEKEMAACSSILAWRSPKTEEPGPWGHREPDTNEVTRHTCALRFAYLQQK